MASSKEDGTVAAAAQLGSMSLGESEESKDNDTEDAEENNEAPTKMCSACGKKSSTLKKRCNGCKCVWYCNKACLNKHRVEHKKECRKIKKVLDKRGGKLDIGTELDVGPVGKLPLLEECLICARVLPFHDNLQTYYNCCGKTVCGGCDLQHQIKCRERVAGRGQVSMLPTCAFCRTTIPGSDEEMLVNLRKRLEHKDPKAMVIIALGYGGGGLGLPVDQAKCIDLLRESAGLGCPPALRQLGNFHDHGEMGLEQNEEKAFKCWEEAAEGGHLPSVHNLGCVEADNGDNVAAMRHWRLSASGGSKRSMANLVVCFEDGLLRHGALAETLQAMYRSRAEMRSKDRDMFIEHLKTTGEYEEEYDF